MYKSVLIIMLFILVFSVTACSKEQTEITVYTALEDDQIPRYLESFEKKYPDIKVNIVRDSTGIITAKLLAEKENPQADIIWGTAATSLLVLDREDVLEPYAPKGVERVYQQFKDEREVPHWVGIDAWMTGIVVNTEEIKAKGIPRPTSYQDLIKPEYKGALVMPNPASSGTGFLTLSAFIQIFGKENAWEYMDKLHKNIALYTHSGSKPAKLAGAGEYPIGISFGYRGIIQKSKGQPIEVVFPKEGSGWDVEANALIKKNDIKEEAKVFLDWAISDEMMKEYNKNFAIITVPNENTIPEGFPKNPLQQLIKNDLNWAAENRKDILEKWEARYGAKGESKK